MVGIVEFHRVQYKVVLLVLLTVIESSIKGVWLVLLTFIECSIKGCGWYC